MRLIRVTTLCFAIFAFAGCEGETSGPPAFPGFPGGDTSATSDVEETPSDAAEENTESSPVGCTTDEDCSTEGVCQVATCDTESGECVIGPADEGTACDDGVNCTENDVCDVDGNCAGTTVDCEDGDPCTDNSCDEEAGCVSSKTTAPCDDGDLCTVEDTCDDGECFGVENLCDDGDACTTGICDDESGDCNYEQNTFNCDDGDPCTSGDTCTEGTCAGEAINCDDNNTCTTDICDPEQGFCTFTFTAQECEEGEECEAPVEPCDDGAPCTINDSCQQGVCMGEYNPCDDEDDCTDDTCEAGIGCAHTPNTASCFDDNSCTVDDTCTDGVCGGAPADCSDGKDCTLDTCDPALGCQHNFSDELPCNDNDKCTESDQCNGGACEGTAITCDDGDICTADICIKAIGCDTSYNNAGCDDGDACTETDACSLGTCAGLAVTCDDENPCTDDTCDPAEGCVYTPNTVECDDDNICTENDLCIDTACVGTTVECDDDNACTIDECISDLIGSPGCIYTELNGDLCDDGSLCTENDICVVGQCQGSFSPGCSTPVCGDDACTMFEDCSTCPEDCGQCCGDGLCLAEETCASCEEDCGACPPSYCDTDLVDPYDFCGGDCNPTEGNEECDPNALCVPTIADAAIGDVFNEEAFSIGNGACGEPCAASFQCSAGSICLSANGLVQTGICAKTCEVGDDSVCTEGLTCVANNASPTDGLCLPGPSCDTSDADACANLETNTCVQTKPGTTE